jgi:beta-lactam-binding protein with PASTA domain
MPGMRRMVLAVFLAFAVGCTGSSTTTPTSTTTTTTTTSPPPLPVPDVMGMTSTDAKAALDDAGLSWDVTTQPTHDAGRLGTVFKQDPDQTTPSR